MTHLFQPTKSACFSTLLILTALFVSGVLTGCADAVFTDDDPAVEARQTHTGPKLRHAHLMDRATKRAVGKSASSQTLGLIVAAQSTVDKQKIVERYRTAERYKIANRYKIAERYDYNHAFPGVAWIIDDSLGLGDYQEFLDTLAADPDILWFEPDFDVTTPPSDAAPGGSGQQIPWSVAAIGGQSSWAVSGDGTGSVDVDVYILDTGIANANNSDPNDDLALVESIDFRDGFNDAKDYDGHGTHVAGIVGAVDDNDGLVGVAPGAKIHNYKVLGDNGSSDVSVVIAAIEHITALKLASPSQPMVVNLSLGEDIDTPSYSALDEAVDVSVAAGVVYVIAAGNQIRNVSNVTPAKVPGAITVGSYHGSGLFSTFSNWGPKVDILAPGEDVVSLSPNGGPVEMTGTSMSAAHVSGAAALYLAQNPTASPSQVESALVAAAQDFVVGTNGSTTNQSVFVGLPQSLDVRVATGKDDVEEYTSNGTMNRTSSDLELADDFAHAGTSQVIGMRFRDLGIPQGAIITNAYVQFTVDEASSGAANLTIHGQDADNAASFSSSNYNLTSRATTSASVAWSPPAWTSVGAAGADQRTPDLSSVIQEIVDRGGWSSCNAMVIVISGTGKRTAESHNGSSSKAPLLHVEWSGGSGGTCGGSSGEGGGDD